MTALGKHDETLMDHHGEGILEGSYTHTSILAPTSWFSQWALKDIKDLNPTNELCEVACIDQKELPPEIHRNTKK